MPALSEYSNVYNSALLVLSQKGFQVWYDQNAQQYCAERDGWDFMSSSPCGLLGVVAIFEAKKPKQYAENWWREEGPLSYRKLPSLPTREYEPIWKKKTTRQ